jgi:pyruvate/2-oxoacid:ferredoxin oxidoreductase alpha subunit
LWKLDLDYPFTHGSVIYPDDYEEVRYSMFQALDNSRKVIRTAAEEYRDIVGNYHGDLIETYRMEGAESALVAMGSIASEAKMAVDMLRDAGYPCGLVRVRSYRPFPIEELRTLLAPLRAVLVIDRGVSFGMEGPMYSEVKAVIYGRSDAEVYDIVTGLGGRDVTYELIFDNAEAALKGKLEQKTSWPAVSLNEHHRISKKGLEEYWKKEGVK